MSSSALHSYAGVPSASTALTQPDPITNATSWEATPVRSAISAAAISAAASGSV
ncbi:unannotated protein [freshwater metagenome]|uniref:Unannotated protein n=1 Tax=freshwater metagenome TaxID=449393 RepID=A0A6J6U9L9_9ZZZZ